MDNGKFVGGVWLPRADKRMLKDMRDGKSGIRDGKLTYQLQKLDTAMKYQENFRTCVDIGAHVGLWSMWLVKLFDTVHAFDPIEDIHRDLFEKNAPDAIFHPFAIGHQNQTMGMQVFERRSCVSFISHDGDDPRGQGAHSVSRDVEMRTLDSFELQDVDFIKIDTEGFELHVIKGAMETIERCRPNIVIEQSQAGAYYGHDPKAGAALLEELGMVCKGIMGPDHIMVWECS